MDNTDRQLWLETRPCERKYLHAALRLLRSPYRDLLEAFQEVVTQMDLQLAARIRGDEAAVSDKPKD